MVVDSTKDAPALDGHDIAYVVSAACTRTHRTQILAVFMTREEAVKFADMQIARWSRDWTEYQIDHSWRPFSEQDNMKTVVPLFRSLYFLVEKVAWSPAPCTMAAVGNVDKDNTYTDTPLFGWPAPE